MADRTADWLRQAEHTLIQAKRLAETEGHDWACFLSQQAAEMAIEALHYRFGQEAWGHSLVRLFAMLPAAPVAPQELVEKARVLDFYYIPTRYANGHSEGSPFEKYGPRQSTEAIHYAGEIIEFARSRLA